MALPEWSGDPPAVTSDMIVAWNKLADDVTAALTQGGEQGMDLLVAVMPEWVEAADDANAARQICVDLARAGRRHEAVLWHADGFFEAADRLTPDRAGWEEWQLALAERGVVVPELDLNLKDEADRIHEELLLRDITGTSLDEYLVHLRRNVISRGHYGDRLMILQAIRGIDPTGSAWEDMIGPIRGKRAGEIVGELLTAISDDDFFTIDRIRREVESTQWGGDVPGTLYGMLQATTHWHSLVEAKRVLTSTAGALVEKCAALTKLDWESAHWPAILDQAMQVYSVYDAHRRNAMSAMQEVQAVPAVAARVAAGNYAAFIQRLDDDTETSVAHLKERIRWGHVRAKIIKVERKIGDIQAASPLEIGNWEQAKRATRKWLQEVGSCRRRADDLTIEHRMPLPESTRQSLQDLATTEKAVRARLQKITFWERLTIAGVLGGIVLIGLVLVGVIIVSSAGNPGK
jgi:hypothetical protein